MSDQAGDNLVLRTLQKLRDDMEAGFRTARADTSDLRRDVSEGFTRMTDALTALSRQNADTRAELGRQIADLRAEIGRERDAGRIAALEARVADLERLVRRQ